MQSQISKLLMGAAALSLAACGTEFETPENTALLQELEALNTEVAENYLNFTPTEDLPASANYTGIMHTIIGTDSTTSYVGDMTLSVDFTGGGINGSANGFHSYPSEEDPATATLTPVSGTLDLNGSYTGTNGLITPAVSGTVSGTLDGTTGTSDLGGNFLGATGEFANLNFWGAFNGLAVAQQ